MDTAGRLVNHRFDSQDAIGKFLDHREPVGGDASLAFADLRKGGSADGKLTGKGCCPPVFLAQPCVKGITHAASLTSAKHNHKWVNSACLADF